MSIIYLAGGCFWGTQKYFDQFDGVLQTETGYANGSTKNPSYEEVKYHNTGHAETVRITFDEGRLSLEKLLEYFFFVIDPFSVNRQGEDEGIQYRTGIYYTNPDQESRIRMFIRAQEQKLGGKVAVEVKPLENYYSAEEYHQKYLEKNPGGYCHIGKEYFTLQEKLKKAN